MTVTVQIGNSDDKLSQERWSVFIGQTGQLIRSTAKTIHFSGGSAANSPWQNYCWVAEMDITDEFMAACKDLAKRFSQDSISITTGTTTFVG